MLKCIMATLISKLIACFLLTALISFVLLFLRDDKREIMRDLKRGYRKTWLVAMGHTLVIIAILPLTLPFTLGRILNRWF